MTDRPHRPRSSIDRDLDVLPASRGCAGPDAALRRGYRWRGAVKPIGDLTASEIALWQHLTATRHELRSPYFSFEFSRAVAEAGAPARVALLYDDGTLAGFFPYQFAGKFTRSMAAGERIGGALNDCCGVVLDRSRHASIGTRDLLRCAGLASFDFSHLEETQPGLGLRLGVRSQGSRIKLETSLQRYWGSVKSGHPSAYDTLRNRERKIEREFRIVDFVFAHNEPGELLKLVVTEKRQRYEETGARDGFAEPWKLRCLDRIARYREGRCVPVLSALRLDGNWAALHFGIRAGNVLHYAFPVYNPQFSKLSPGLILLAKIISEAASHGIDEIDLAEGSTGYKSLFANAYYPMYRGVWHRTSPRGVGYRGYLSLLWRMRKLRKSRS
jgi:CelD/BcsL family acetyltransferase involved in cellulose biosynthesis